MRRGIVVWCARGGGGMRRRLPLPLQPPSPSMAVTSTRRALHATRVARTQQQQQQQPASPRGHDVSADDGDFVNVDELLVAAMGDDKATSSWRRREQQQQPPLGVVRHDVVDPSVELSRLALPLQQPRHGASATRAGSRRCVAREDNADEADEGSAMTTSSGDGDTPVDTTLAYDDEKFAETLLQMEVDGVMDEVWQDAARAHLEDVRELAEVLRAMRVRDVCCIDVTGKTSSFDYVVLGTCEGARHMHLAAWAVQEADALRRVTKVPRRHVDEQWEVVTVGRIVVNLMRERLREAMTLERKWAVTTTMDPLAAANAPIGEGRLARAHGLWTLTLNLQDLADFEVDYCKDVLVRQA